MLEKDFRVSIKSFCLIAVFCFASITLAEAQRLPSFYSSRAEKFISSNAWEAAKREIDTGMKTWPEDPNLRYLNGCYYYAMGDLKRARYNLVKAIQANDQHSKARRKLVDVEDDSKHYSSAICYINELLELQPYDKDLWRRKIGLYKKSGNQTEADDALERLSRIYPNDSIIRKDLRIRHRENSNRLLRQNRLEENAQNLERWIELDSHNLSYYIELFSIYHRMGEFDHAIGIANRGLSVFPHNAELSNRLIGLLSEMGLYTQALNAAHQYAPNSPTYRYILKEVANNARLNDPYEANGRLYAETKDQDALNYMLNTSLTRCYYDDARYYLHEAMLKEGRTTSLLMKQYSLEKHLGNETESRKILQELYEHNPTDEELIGQYANMMIALGNSDMALQQWTDANRHLQKAYELISKDNKSWPAIVSQRIICLGNMGKLEEAASLYQTAASTDPDNKLRYASAYEDVVAIKLHALIEEESYEEAFKEAEKLLEIVPTSQTALRCCINMCQTLKREEAFRDYAKRGYDAYPDVPYFIIKQAISLQHQNQNAKALSLIHPQKSKEKFQLPQFSTAYSGISQEWAGELLKQRLPDMALAIIDSALIYDPNNKELLYSKGLAYEQLKNFEKAYAYQSKYYNPSNAEQADYYQHMRYLGFRSFKNRVDASYTSASFDSRNSEIASSTHLYTVASVSYSRLQKDNTYTGQLSYKGIDGSHIGDNHESGGIGLELMAQWDHTFDSHWSGMANLSYSTKFFNKIGANVSLAYSMSRGWTPSLRLGYRRTPETYLYFSSADSILLHHGKYNLFIFTPAIEKSWERIKTFLTVDLMLLKSNLYYNVGMKGKLFFNEDNISSVSLVTGFGSFPELSFFEQTALQNVSHTNAMLGFDIQYLISKHLYVGLSGNWNTCYNPYRTADMKLIDSYRNIYSLSLHLHTAF